MAKFKLDSPKFKGELITIFLQYDVTVKFITIFLQCDDIVMFIILVFIISTL